MWGRSTRFGECSLLCTWDCLARHSPKLVCMLYAVCCGMLCKVRLWYCCMYVGRTPSCIHVYVSCRG